ncbi:MAG: hypothetical protein R2712_10300 [Vicinamibacterales bacterium]
MRSATSTTRRRGGEARSRARGRAYFNLDNGTAAFAACGGRATSAPCPSSSSGASVQDLGFKAVSPRSVTSTDHVPFDAAGLPGFQFIQERLEHQARTHHLNMITFDHVQAEDLCRGAVAAVFAGHAANWPEKLPRRRCRRARAPGSSTTRSRQGLLRPPG